MTGNTVIFGLALAGPDRSRVLDAVLAIFAFGVGVLIAAITLLRRRSPEGRGPLRVGASLELSFAVVFATLWATFPESGPAWSVPAIVASGGCALGIQSVAARQLRISGVVTTFITGTITTAIVSFLERNAPGAQLDSRSNSSPLLLAGMVAIYVAAAMSGAVLTSLSRPFAPVAAIIPILIVLVRAYQLSA
jgi:uncharacterized membrane protein YoaK (UPF0700 family)